MAAVSWDEYLRGYKKKDGTYQKGNIGNVVDGVTGIANTGIAIASYLETKEQNKRTDEQNKVNSANAAKAYNENLDSKTNSRLAAMGASNGAISDYQKNNEEYKKRKAQAYK